MLELECMADDLLGSTDNRTDCFLNVYGNDACTEDGTKISYGPLVSENRSACSNLGATGSDVPAESVLLVCGQ